MPETHPIKKYCTERDISLRKLARRVGSTGASLSRICRGQQDPSAELIRALKEETGLSADEILFQEAAK